MPAHPVLLHGFAGSSASWDPRVIDGLTGARFTPSLVDLPGHGAGAGTHEAERLTLGAALDAVARAGSWPEDLAGYSMGGRIALHFAAAFPERVRRLVLESASPGIESETERITRRVADEALAKDIGAKGIEWFVDHWESQPIFASRARIGPVERVRQREIRLRNDPRSLAASLRGLGTGTLPSLWGRLGGIAAPTLLIVGELDTKFVGIARAMAKEMPDARVVIVPGVGHTVHLEAPAVWVDTVVAFLAS